MDAVNVGLYRDFLKCRDFSQNSMFFFSENNVNLLAVLLLFDKIVFRTMHAFLHSQSDGIPMSLSLVGLGLILVVHHQCAAKLAGHIYCHGLEDCLQGHASRQLERDHSPLCSCELNCMHKSKKPVMLICKGVINTRDFCSFSKDRVVIFFLNFAVNFL